MKGPGLRLLVDVRRTWRCPRCGYEEHVGAQVTTVACPCCPGVAMKLCEQNRVYAEELAKLRNRPKPEPASDDNEFSLLSEAESETAATDDASHIDAVHSSSQESQPPKRRGARPHKQSRRGQHKHQQQSAPPPDSDPGDEAEVAPAPISNSEE